MFPNNDKVTVSQMVTISILTMVGIGILTLPRELIGEAGTDGWMVLILGGLGAIAVSFTHGYIIKSFPGKSYFEILSITLTKPIAYILGLYTIIYLLGIMSYVVRTFGMTVKEFLLPETPPEFVILPILLVSAYLVRKGIEVLGRMAEIIIVPLSAVIVILFFLSWRNAEVSNLLPVFQTPSLQIIKAVPFALFSFLGFEVLLVFGGFMDKPKKATRVGPIAIFFVLLLYQLLNASVLTVLGSHQTERLIWPLLATFRTIELPGAFIENVEIFVMAVWVFTVFMTMVPLYLGGCLLMMELAGGKDHSYYSLLPLPFIAVLSVWDDSIADVYESLGKFSDYTAYGVVLLVPLGILIALLVRKRKKNEDRTA
ncbi:spore germination protein [Natronincola peptidivorans]|uniref:Spore germination protein n=1 Tax=Natronincola peptidivorans TaxID=426128 RepID=A0A1I0AJQ6_9FIRM|nr:endospore germination permease [Natronincola peptidivorans]SES94537.1 spore germination protein [Natronincola peptidivorans]